VVPLRHHLRPEEHRALRLGEARERRGELLGLRDRVGVQPDQLEVGQLAGEVAL